MRDSLPNKINEIECRILNSDISKNNDTHCVSLCATEKKMGQKNVNIFYF